MVIIKMIIKWYSIAKLTSGKRIKYWYIALNRIKWISMITETCNPVRCNSQTCLHLNTKRSVFEYVYPRVCAAKSGENTRRNWQIHRQRGALSRAPFQQLIRQRGRNGGRGGEWLRAREDVLQATREELEKPSKKK